MMSIYLNWAPVITVDPPVDGINLLDGLDFLVTTFSTETQNLLNGLATASVNDSQIFFVNYFLQQTTTTTHGIAYPDFATPGSKYVNSIIVNTVHLSLPPYRHTIAHEIGHVLENAEHWGGEGDYPLSEEELRNLMAVGLQRNPGESISGGKRLAESQSSVMLDRLEHRFTEIP